MPLLSALRPQLVIFQIPAAEEAKERPPPRYLLGGEGGPPPTLLPAGAGRVRGSAYSLRVACRISASACFSRESSFGFQRFSIPILYGLQSGQERRFRLSRLRMGFETYHFVFSDAKIILRVLSEITGPVQPSPAAKESFSLRALA